jgi:hypothetical protein
MTCQDFTEAEEMENIQKQKPFNAPSSLCCKV